VQFILGQAIGWKSVRGPKHTGRVSFAPVGDDTLLNVTMNYAPPLGIFSRAIAPLSEHLEDYIDQALRDFKAGSWYGAADVDKLSEREAQVIAARLVKRANGRLALSADRLSALEKDLSAAIAKILTDDECESKERALAIDLTKVARKHLDERQLAELSKAAEQGVRALDGETR